MDLVPEELGRVMGVSHEHHQHKIFDCTLGRRKFIGGCLELREASSREVGNIIILKDFTAEKKALWRLMTILSFVGLTVGSFLILLFYKLIDRVENNLARTRKTLTAQHEELKKAHAELKGTQAQIQIQIEVIC